MKKLLLVSAVGLALSGCGGGSGGGNNDNNGGSVTPPAKVNTVTGSIDAVNTAKNSITVNGREFVVGKAMFNNEQVSNFVVSSSLKDMTVQVDTSAVKQTATVTLEPTMTGEITAIDHVKNTFTINGLELHFAGLSSEIGLNDWVMVSSLPVAPTAENGNQSYKVLSVIKFDMDGVRVDEIEGQVSSINANDNTFKIGAITISYSNIDNLTNGLWVEVEGTFDESSKKFIATEVEIDGYDNQIGENEVEGIVTWVSKDKSAFELNSRGTFTVSPITQFEDGSKQNLKLGGEVEVVYSNKSGQLVALEVEFENTGDDNDDLWEQNEFECSGLVVNYSEHPVGVSASFDIEDLSPNENHGVDCRNITINKSNAVFEDNLSFNNLNNEKVEVEGITINGQKVALEVEAWEADD
ncbi:hypothetical protein ACOMICROBIO_GDFFDHBD_02111 [Vibrio sp. B1REV9]|uniref:DUF5666 domain-containing protein n=1 Tax=Vibrio sp. B1REV9 TaxID=2751179 RepID=UPI001AF0E763|nr:DUF5666 domain-containing protein [Vibrio sp. B1REV9]CAE6923279.1 hypothetical protein ACOMICROBIO_GDFFDHBD_02111 [Vibrio sp. B1REV9]